jgi:V8-like Glu-specific endopeptidase
MKMLRNNTFVSFVIWLCMVLSEPSFHPKTQLVHASDSHANSNYERSLIDFTNNIEPRIVGGTNTKQRRYPYMVFLANRDDQLSCGGTLISPTVVLTGAHCEK